MVDLQEQGFGTNAPYLSPCQHLKAPTQAELQMAHTTNLFVLDPCYFSTGELDDVAEQVRLFHYEKLVKCCDH